MRIISLGLLISGKEVAGVNGLMDEKNGVKDYEQMVEWEREWRGKVFGNSILDAYEKLTQIAEEEYPDFDYRITIDKHKND